MLNSKSTIDLLPSQPEILIIEDRSQSHCLASLSLSQEEWEIVSTPSLLLLSVLLESLFRLNMPSQLLALKKLPSILVDETSVQKIQILTPNIGVVYSGMGPDSRVLVRKSRKQAEQYNLLYKEAIPVTQLVRETAAVMQEFTQSGGVRPFGVSLLVAGYDDKGPQLYQVDPSGSYFSWKASAMGKNVSNAKMFLEKRYTDDMELEDAIHTAILTLKGLLVFEGQISGKNIEIGVIEADRTFRVLTAAQIEDYLQEVE
uniref:Putative proteasome, subunit alpha/beta, nucleophile aminohydrolase n=1 Tax=Helianthus annuus TaxID=4232 RepID=A0A251VDM2_HELAN